MTLFKENEKAFNVSDEELEDKIKEALENWDGSNYYDDRKQYSADIKIGKEVYYIEVPADIPSEDSGIIFDYDSISVKRIR